MHVNHCNFAGNQTLRVGEATDYYTSYSFPNFATVEKSTTVFSLEIHIVQDNILESTELFRIVAISPNVPSGYLLCSADVIIVDDDDDGNLPGNVPIRITSYCIAVYVIKSVM